MAFSMFLILNWDKTCIQKWILSVEHYDPDQSLSFKMCQTTAFLTYMKKNRPPDESFQKNCSFQIRPTKCFSFWCRLVWRKKKNNLNLALTEKQLFFFVVVFDSLKLRSKLFDSLKLRLANFQDTKMWNIRSGRARKNKLFYESKITYKFPGLEFCPRSNCDKQIFSHKTFSW